MDPELHGPHSTLGTFIAAIKHDINSSKMRPLPKDNLTHKERQALSD